MRRAENLATMRVSDSFLPKVYRKRTVYIFSASFSTFSSFEDKADKSDIPGAGITARSLLEMRFRSVARDFILFGYRCEYVAIATSTVFPRRSATATME